MTNAIISAALQLYRNKPKDSNEGDVYFTDFTQVLDACENYVKSRSAETIEQYCGRCSRFGCLRDRAITIDDIIKEFELWHF